MKKWLSVVAVVVLCLAMVVGIACGGGEDGAGGVKQVKFAYTDAMSGILGAIVGVPAKQGVELAAERIGEFTVGGELYRWKLIFEDNEWTSAGGMATATKFIYDDGVKLMHQGGADSGMAAQTLCEESGVLVDISSGGMEPFGPDKPYSMQIAAMYMLHMPAFFKWFTEQHPEVKTVAMIEQDDAVGHARMECQIAAAEYFGLEMVLEDYYPVETTEVYPIATRVMAKDPDFFVGSWSVLKAMQEMGYEGLSAFCLWMQYTGGDVGFENFQGHLCYLPLPFGEGLPPALDEFAEEYEARYGVPCELCSFYAALVLYAFTDILQQAGTVDDMDKILAAIDTETFDTVLFGPMRFCGEELIGINRVLLWPIQIHEFRGEQPHVVFTMDAEDAYDLALEVFGE